MDQTKSGNFNAAGKLEINFNKSEIFFVFVLDHTQLGLA